MKRRDLILGLAFLPLVPAVAFASKITAKPPRRLRMCSNYLCECGLAMLFTGGTVDGRLRHMACPNDKCEHFGAAIQEPDLLAQETL